MSNGLLELIIKVTNLGTPELDKAAKSSNKLKDSVGNLCSQFDKLKSSVQFLISGYFGWRGLQSFIKSSDTAEASIAGFRQSLISMGRYTPEFERQMIQVSASLQKVTTFGDEAIVEGMKFLNTYEKIPNELMPRVSASMTDIAALMRGDMTSAANMLGKASMGMTGELRRAGISVDENTYKSKGFLGVLEQIEKQVKGQAAALRNTGYGEMKAFGNLVDDVKEKLGDFIKVSLSAFFRQANNDLINLNEQMERAKTKFESAAKTIGEFALKIYNTAKAVIQFTREHSELVKTILYSIAVGYTAIKVFGLIKGAIMGVAGAFAFLTTAAGGWTLILTALSLGVGALVKSYIEQKVVMNELMNIEQKYADIRDMNIQQLKDEHYWNLKKAESLEKIVKEYETLKNKGKLTTDEQKRLKDILGEIQKNYPQLIAKTDEYGNALEINTNKANEFIQSLKKIIVLQMQETKRTLLEDIDKLKLQISKYEDPKKIDKVMEDFKRVKNWRFSDKAQNEYIKSQTNPLNQKLNEYTKKLEDIDLYLSELQKVDTKTYIPKTKKADIKNSNIIETASKTPYETAEREFEKWFIETMRKDATSEQQLDYWKKFETGVTAAKAPAGEEEKYADQKLKYVSKLIDLEKATSKEKDTRAELENETTLRIRLLNEQDEYERKKIEAGLKYQKDYNAVDEMKIEEQQKNQLRAALEKAHSDELDKIDEERKENTLKLEREKQQELNNYLKESKDYKEKIAFEELDAERDVLLKKYESNVEVQEMIKKVYAEKSEALKEQFKDYTNFTASELMRMLEIETTTAEQREKINKALNEKLKKNNLSAIEAFEIGWQRAEQNFKTLNEVIEQAGQDLANTLQSSMSNFIQDSIKNVSNLKDAWINFSRSMRDAFVKAIADMIVSQMKFNTAKSMIGGALSFIGGLFGGGTNTGNYSYGAGDSPLKLATGGLVSGPGTGTSDDIFAKLSNGEFVVNALMTQKFRPLLEAINSNKIPRFAKGGIAGGSAGSATGQYGDNQEMNIQINNIFDAANVFMRGLMSNKNSVINMIADEAQKNLHFRAALAGRQ